METKELSIKKSEVFIIKSENSNTALICIPYISKSGVTVNFINFKEFEKNCKKAELESKGLTVNIHSINSQKRLIVKSHLATENISTVFYEATYGSTTNPTWSILNEEEILTK